MECTRRRIKNLACAVAFTLIGPTAAQGGPSSPGAASSRDAVHEDLQYAEGVANEPRRNRLDLYVPGGAPRPPLVMFVHGGVWTGGKKEIGSGLARALSAHGIACACINTQLFPFGKPADMVDDCGRALAWLHRHADEYGYDGSRLFLMGHSSGAHLVSWLGLEDARLAATGVPRAAIGGILALSGVHELRVRHPALDRVFGDDLAARGPAAPFAHASANDPPMLLLWGQRDMPGMALSARMLRDRLRDLGVGVQAGELSGRGHTDYFWELQRREDPVLARIVAFVDNPPGPSRATAGLGDVQRQTVQLPAGGGRCQLLLPAARAATATLLWAVADAAERQLAEVVALALVPHGIAVAVQEPGDGAVNSLVVAWQQLQQQAAGLRLPAPRFLGGAAAGGRAVALAPLGWRDGLHGRIVAGAQLGDCGDLVAQLAGDAREARPALLLVQADGDPSPARNHTMRVGLELAQRQLDVHVIEVAGASTAAALQALGAEPDVLLPMLRAFLLP
ncbi:MAG: alpha/beta hydrolase [Planctomycetes bacterium]|jgi:acetyl esterase/lipase|nr:alpha/beta hydrolase [Planctomycetota bacterium]